MTEQGERFFPFATIRAGQREFMKDVRDTIESGKILIAHAPTGIGKTVAVLVPAVQYALENEKTVFFLTSKRSQHKIAIDTLRQIKESAGPMLNLVAVDITSKQSMCPRATSTSVQQKFYSLFNDFCRYGQKNKLCQYFMKNDEEALQRIRYEILHVEELCKWCATRGVCPHKTALEVAEEADVVVCDYNYLFAPDIAERILERIETRLDDLIVIVDEAHNLSDRIRNNLSNTLRMSTVRSAARAIRYLDREMHGNLVELENIFTKLVRRASANNEMEIAVERDFLEEEMEKVLRRRIDTINYDEFVERLQSFVEDFENKKEKENELEEVQQNIFTVAEFLDKWRTSERCVRIFSLAQRDNPVLYFKLLDPSVISEQKFARAHSTILMSGTLCPTSMYADLLGVTQDRIKGKEIDMREYKSPFPEENRKIVVTEELTTKYTERGEEMYRRVAVKIGEVARYVIGSMAVFFPSYALLNSISAYLPRDVSRRAMVERQKMSKREKNRLYELLRDTDGGILLAVQGGSLSEGIDYESNTLKAIIVVGLPLSPPTLEIKTIERYYAGKYGSAKGRLYGYLYPAITKVLQAAGRGIRSEQDRCIIILMDYRFAQYPYKNCLPPDYEVTVTGSAEVDCKKFFARL